MAQTGRSNVRYVDPQRRYTVVLGPHGTPLSKRCPTTTALERTIGFGYGHLKTSLRRFSRQHGIYEVDPVGSFPTRPHVLTPVRICLHGLATPLAAHPFVLFV
jgi:hypothetical protein